MNCNDINIVLNSIPPVSDKIPTVGSDCKPVPKEEAARILTWTSWRAPSFPTNCIMEYRAEEAPVAMSRMGRGPRWERAPKFFKRLVREVHAGNGIEIPWAGGFKQFIIYVGELYGIWTLGMNRTRWSPVPQTGNRRELVCKLMGYKSWGKAMRSGEKNLALVLHAKCDWHEAGFDNNELYIRGLGFWDLYEAQNHHRQQSLKRMMTTAWFQKLGARRRVLFLKRMMTMKEKQAFARTFRGMHPAVRNQLRQLTSNDTWSRKLQVLINTHGNQHLNLETLMSLISPRDLANPEMQEKVEGTIIYLARNPDGVQALQNFLTEWDHPRYNGNGVPADPRPEFWNMTPQQLEALHEELVVERYNWQVKHGYVSKHQKFQQQANELAKKLWDHSLAEMRSTVGGTRLLETEEDYQDEGDLMNHCVGWYYRSSRCKLILRDDRPWCLDVSLEHCYHLECGDETATLLVELDWNGIKQVQFYGVANKRVSDDMVRFGNEFSNKMGWKYRGQPVTLVKN